MAPSLLSLCACVKIYRWIERHGSTLFCEQQKAHASVSPDVKEAITAPAILSMHAQRLSSYMSFVASVCWPPYIEAAAGLLTPLRLLILLSEGPWCLTILRFMVKQSSLDVQYYSWLCCRVTGVQMDCAHDLPVAPSDSQRMETVDG